MLTLNPTVSKKVFNPNLIQLTKSYHAGRKTALGGSSRSGKTYSGIDFIIYYCSKLHPGGGKNIRIVRETYKSFKTTLYDDFNERLPAFGVKSPFKNVQERPSFNLYGNKITLIGADNPDMAHGVGSDVVFFNEAMSIPKSVFSQLIIRCKDFWWMDYNPQYSDHWIYDEVLTREDVDFLRTTFRDNPFCPANARDEILRFNPWHPDDEQLPEAQRRPHPINIPNGTADKMMWEIYGLGIKSEKKGRIYPNIHEYSTLPEGARFLGYSGDWGFNHPTVVVALYAYGNNLYVREVIHAPGMDYNDIYRKMIADGCKDRTDDCVFDSEDPRGIQALKRMGLRIWRAYKKQGWVMHTIKTMRGLKIHIHIGSASVRKDFENYCWKWDDLTDKPLDVPMETGKDSCDAVGYGVIRFISRIEAE